MQQAFNSNPVGVDTFTLEDRVKLIRKYVHDSIPLELEGWRIIGGDRVSREARFKAIVDYPGNSNSGTDIVKDELQNVIKSMLYGVPSVHLIDLVNETPLNYYTTLMSIYSDIRYKYWDMSPINNHMKSYNLMDLDRFLDSEDLVQVPMLMPGTSTEYHEKFDVIGWETCNKEIVVDKYIRLLPFTLVELLRSGYPVNTLIDSVTDDLNKHISNFIMQTSVAYSSDITDLGASDFDWQALSQIFNKSEKDAAHFAEYNSSGDLLALLNYMEGVKESNSDSEMCVDMDYDDYDYAASKSHTDSHIYFRFVSKLLSSVYVNESLVNEFIATLNIPDEVMNNVSLSDLVEMIATYKPNDDSELAIVYRGTNNKDESSKRSRSRRPKMNTSRMFSPEEMTSEYYFPRTLDKMFMLENDGKLAYGSMLGIDVQCNTDPIFRIKNC